MLLNTTSNFKVVSRQLVEERKQLSDVSGQPQILGKTSMAFEKGRNGQIARIKQMLEKVDLSTSWYDTAWVAMVPSREQSNASRTPFFPETLNSIMENQHPDGSWCLDPGHPLLIKDSLSSTLACVIALHKWKVGHQLVHKGLDYIESNIWAVNDTQQYSPIGFDVIFTSMAERARDMGLTLPLASSSLDSLLRNRDLQLNNMKGRPKQVAYIGEGIRGLNKWEETIKKYQRSNGSLFNSPSTTAAALLNLHDDKCFDYLNSLALKFGNQVPTAYPLDMYTQLHVIDDLEKLGIDRYFKAEICTILDNIYRKWQLEDEEIFLDTSCCAMGFRLLRMHGYDVSCDVLANYEEQEGFTETASGSESDTKAILELYRASLVSILQNESTLERTHRWTSSYLQAELQSKAIKDKSLHNEVAYYLSCPQASLERIESRTMIQNYNIDKVPLLKTSYRTSNVDSRDLLTFSSQDYNNVQSVFREELNYLHSWVEKCRMPELKFARQKITYTYFSAASVLVDPRLSDARISFAQNSVLVTLVDDFFDYGGSMEELENLMELVKRWDDYSKVGFCSQAVEILFFALYETINQTAEKACVQQGRCVKDHLIEIWMVVFRSMMKEAKNANDNMVPTLFEYMANGYDSFALGPLVLIPQYFLGAKLSEEVVHSEEYNKLYMHMSMIGRIVNDRATVKKENAEGKLNSVSIQVIHGHGEVSEEDAIKTVTRIIDSHRRELLRLVVKTEGSVVPRVCRELFWKTSKIMHLFYMNDDGYTSNLKMLSEVNLVVNEPIVLQPYM